MKKFKILIMMAILQQLTLSSNIQSTAKEVQVDIVAEVNRKMSITDTSGNDISNLVFYHGRWNATDLGSGNRIDQDIQINGLTVGSNITLELIGEMRSKAYLVHQDFNNIELENNLANWQPGVLEKHRGAVLPHQYLINVNSGTTGIVSTAEMSYISNYENQGPISLKSDNFKVLNEKVELSIGSEISGTWSTINPWDKYPGRFYNRTTLRIKVSQP